MILAQMNPRTKSTVPNSKNDSHYMAIATRRGKVIDDAKLVPKKVGRKMVSYEKVDNGGSSAPI